MNDTPLSNLISNTRLGQWLFPHSYANRGSAFTYEPQTFVDWFERELPLDAPVFVATHLTLAHWPYSWATAPRRELSDTASLQHLYSMSVAEVDKQFASVMRVLQRRGLLNNALVVVMSDHGEAIGKSHDNPYDRTDSKLSGLIRLGHGTSVLSPQQYRVVLGMKAFGPARRSVFGNAREVGSPVMLTDLAPTILDFLEITPKDDFDGTSLVKLLSNDISIAESFRERVRFTESEFNPRGFQPGVTLTASALGQIATFYELDPETDRILVKRDRLQILLSDRQYAAISAEHLLAAVPGPAGKGFRLILANRNGGQTLELDPSGENIDENTRKLWNALFSRFGDALCADETFSVGC
jgi:hypothetical protein